MEKPKATGIANLKTHRETRAFHMRENATQLFYNGVDLFAFVAHCGGAECNWRDAAVYICCCCDGGGGPPKVQPAATAAAAADGCH
uniref:Uncharacterized protein n=1 Tax=Romanomermis culicivorax TaxID=13658 RepID=A0A915IXW0_ROMCU